MVEAVMAGDYNDGGKASPPARGPRPGSRQGRRRHAWQARAEWL